MSDSLTFDRFQIVSEQRSKQVFPGCKKWSVSDWAVALAGEAGEVCDAVKKLRRFEVAEPPSSDLDALNLADRRVAHGQLVAKIGDEIGDVVAYCSLLASVFGLNFEHIVRDRFNDVSERAGSHFTL